MNIHFWSRESNRYDDQKDRLRIATVAFCKGFTPNANSKKYYRNFLTVSFRNRFFRFNKEPRKFWVCIFGVEISFKQTDTKKTVDYHEAINAVRKTKMQLVAKDS